LAGAVGGCLAETGLPAAMAAGANSLLPWRTIDQIFFNAVAINYFNVKCLA